MFMWAQSDRGIPRSYRMMQGMFAKKDGWSRADFWFSQDLVSTHIPSPMQRVSSRTSSFTTLLNWVYTALVSDKCTLAFFFAMLTVRAKKVWDEALKLAGQDPDFHRKDLEEAISAGAYPKWKFGIQTIAEADLDKFEFDPLDATKLWPEDEFPVRYIGTIELNRMPDEYFTQTEQVAFCTSHVVPGIGFSDDPLLQGRNFSYFDTQLSRLGINWQELPINRP